MKNLEPIIDNEIINNMKELGNGDNEFSNRLLIVQLISLYLDNLPERIIEITEAIQRKDAKIIERSAHTLKSSSQLIGLVGLAKECQALENMGHAKQLENCNEVYLRIKNTAQKAVEALKNKIIEIESN